MIGRLLIANRGEIAIRVARTAARLGIVTVAVAPDDDRGSLHCRRADLFRLLPGGGPSAYLDIAALIAVARETGCDAVHPGYGFLSESGAFARACADAGLIFVGPAPDQLDALGDKARARALAIETGVPVLAGTPAGISAADGRAFMATLGGPVMAKAVAGGGGRGIRLVRDADELDAAMDRCRSEAERAFGDGRVYLERAMLDARHIEVQVLGDGRGAVIHLGERDCTVQRRNQKLVEIAPSPCLPAALAARLYADACRLTAAIGYANAGTVEFLVDPVRGEHVFLEVNPRLQVEHTVTEALWGVDLVEAQLRIADGAGLDALGVTERQPLPGFAIQARINMERLSADGTPVFSGGTLAAYEPPGGPGVRVDGFGYGGYATNPRFDPLLAKLIVHGAGSFEEVAATTARALAEFRIEGVDTSIGLLRAILAHPLLAGAGLTTRFVDEHLAELRAAAGETDMATPAETPSDDVAAIAAPVTGVLVGLLVGTGADVAAGQPVAVVEAMKMEHLVAAPRGGRVTAVLAAAGAAVRAGEALLTLADLHDADVAEAGATEQDLDAPRADLAEVIGRHAGTRDEARPEAVARRAARGQRTARANVEAVCDPGSFVEFGPLVVAGQRARRSLDDLVRRTPADGVVVGFGTVNADSCPPAAAQALVIAFDETVLAGTVGELAREKMKHALATAYAARRPVVLFAEGGGGRAGDTDFKLALTGWTMDVSTYHQLGRMSGLAPLIGVTSGRCFAANAGMLACCDVIIATERSNIGVGGPAMIEGGRLGRFTPEEIGPVALQAANGVVDLVVADEAEAAAAARAYLGYFQGRRGEWSCADQRALRHVVPENRLRVYEVRRAIELVADTGSVMELRRDFGVEVVTALARVEGRAIGIVANNPLHLGGAIGADGADKASRFMRLCEAFGLPILMLCDTPGVMVGPEAEAQATVRKMGRMFVTGANLTVPVFTVVLRKAYGIGAELMAAGWFKAPRFLVSWPTGEFGGMNIEGNVKLGHAAELAAIADPAERQARFDALVAGMHEVGKALSVATHYEIDDVIDPAETRRWIDMAIMAHEPRAIGSPKTVPFVDPW
ncbi:carboxyl transferase domain-containing protein [Sphingomonas profundi]|uniref:carboxyl transferase domain-containing protein n=1 Tax=Alterirhizorhabdus profundi TaxID=2681549 RepID=UPI0012E70502|nr:carboxyl transferase domain-containing protein [Sphingomonas profundi]